MAFSPVAFIAPNYRDFKDYWLKAYEQGTTTPLPMALESDGGTQVAKLEINKDGFLESAGGALVIPYIDGAYDLFLFPTEAEADANNTTNAEQVADNITGVLDSANKVFVIAIQKYTLAEAVALTTALEGQIVQITDRGNAQFEYKTGQVTNTANIVQCTGVPTLALVLRVKNYINLAEFGSIPGTLSNAAIKAAFDYQQNVRLPILITDTGTNNAIRHMVDVQLNYYAGGIVGEGRFTSNLESTFVGTLIKKVVSSDEYEIADFTLYGSGEGVVGTIGIGAGGGTKGFFGTKFRNVSFRDIEQAVELQFSLFVTFEHCNFRRLVGGVFAIGGGTGWNNTWFNNLIIFNNCVWDECSDFALDFVGTGLELNTPTMQSGGNGLVINRDDSGNSNTNTITNAYFEFNSVNDITLKDTDAVIGETIHQGGDGSPEKPDTLINISIDNSRVRATGRPIYRDGQDERLVLINGSTYTSISSEIVSGKNSADATSEFIYLPDRAADKRLVQTFTDLDTTPVTLAAPIGTSARYTNHVIEWIIEAPNGEYTAFTTYGKLRSGGFKTNVTGNATQVSEVNFTVNLGTGMYTFKTSGGAGTMTIESDQSPETGDTIVTTRVVDSRTEPLF